jgi:hypothetical protein
VGNGGLLKADAWDFYSLKLRTDVVNEVGINGISGAETDRSAYDIDFGDFIVITNFKDIDIVPKAWVPDAKEYLHTVFPDYSFIATGVYGIGYCDLLVTLNGAPVGATSPQCYTVTLRPGLNTVAMTAVSGSMSYRAKDIRVVYNDAEITVSTNLADCRSVLGSRTVFNVAAKGSYGENITYYGASPGGAGNRGGIEVRGSYGGRGYTAAHEQRLWGDGKEDSFLFNLKTVMASAKEEPVPGEEYGIQIRIAVTDYFGRTVTVFREVEYRCAADGEPIGHIYFALEDFTYGKRYVEEPGMLALKEGYTAASLLEEVLAERGYTVTYRNGGDNPVSNNYYLAAVRHPDLYDGKPVGQGTHAVNSCWVYSLNIVFPGYGMGACYPVNGDVFRVRYSLDDGADIGVGWAMDALRAVQTPMNELTKLLAIVHDSIDYTAVDGGAAYRAALNPPNVNNAIASLQRAYFGG